MLLRAIIKNMQNIPSHVAQDQVCKNGGSISLKETASIVGIEKRLTHHIARKTFASTVLLYNNVPMEIVSELLGHMKLATTQQSYGKIVQRKVREEMKRIREVR